VEDDLRKVGVKALSRQEWAPVIREAKAKLKGPQRYRRRRRRRK